MTIRLTWQRALIAVAALAAFGLAFAWSGLFNVAASTGHWQVTDWLLHWTMRNSVRTHALLAEPPDPPARTGLVSAAGHFAQSCAMCHGAPGQRPSPVMQRATPHAPALAHVNRDWSGRQLFWILQHGVKYTGMPAWGAKDRPDEIAHMTAFVQALPTMTPARYRALTGAAAMRGAPAPLATCIGCHGRDGRGRGQGDIPILGGQRPDYLYAALRGYASGARESAVMGAAAAALRDADMRALALYFARRPGLGASPTKRDTAAAIIVARGLPDRQVPACASCHRAGGRAPVLAGQRADYIAARLRHWRSAPGVIDARQSQATMPVIARRLPDETIAPLARYLSGE